VLFRSPQNPKTPFWDNDNFQTVKFKYEATSPKLDCLTQARRQNRGSQAVNPIT
jgi:hypothetical protein